MTVKKTIILKIDPDNPEAQSISEAAKLIRDGGLVAFPTETVYGLGANALNPESVAKIFEAKGRPADNPLIVHISDIDQMHELAYDITAQVQRVVEAFWPGPLTVVLSKKPQIPDLVSAGLNTIAIRMPNHPVALELLRVAGVPIAAPSANSSGKPSPTVVEHVVLDLAGKIDMIVDGGPCVVGLESTVIDMTAEPPVILRPGGVTREEIERVLGHVEVDPALDNKGGTQAPKSPGMKYTHYAPEAQVIVVAGTDYHHICKKITELIVKYQSIGEEVGVLATTENAQKYSADAIFPVGSQNDMETVAQNLFYGLRFLDKSHVDIIIAEGYPERGIGMAIMNRLGKAARNNIIVV